MTNSQAFFESIIHSEHKVYGYKLLPLTLFHLLYLDNLNSPLLQSVVQITPKDIQLAALICSCKNNKEVTYKLRFINVFAFFYKSRNELNKWNEYYSDYLSLPEYYESEGNKNLPFHFSLLLLSKIIKETGYSFEKVFYNMPVGLLIWLSNSFSYMETGETNVISDTEKNIMESFKGI